MNDQPSSPGYGVNPVVAEQASPLLGFAQLQEVNLREILQKLRRRKGLIIGTVVVLMVFSVIVLFQIAPRYTAQTYIMLETRGQNIVDLEAVMAGLSGDVEAVQTEIEVIRSRGLANKVIKRLKLNEVPEFNNALQPEGMFDKYLYPGNFIPEEWLAVLSGRIEEEELTEEEKDALEKAKLTIAFLERLKVSQVGRSRVISVEFTSESKKISANAVNKLADLYVVEQLEAKFEATRRATEWLNERVAELRTAAKASDRAVQAYRKKSGLVLSKGGKLSAQQVSELSTQLILSRAARAEREARLRQVKKLVSRADDVGSIAEVLDSQLIHKLREQEAEVERKVAELSEEFGERHPKMINARAEIRDLNAKVKREVTKIVKGLENEVGIARTREASLRKGLEGLKKEVAKSNQAEVQLRILLRESDANRAILHTFLTRFKETSTQQDIEVQRADARIISKADIPVNPSFPKKKLILALVFVGSTFLGVSLVFAVEQLDRGFRSGDQIEQLTGMHVLGLVPKLIGLSKLGKSPENAILNEPASAFSESIRTLNTALLLSHVKNPPKSILITSSQPNEGKTTIAISLGRMLSVSGRKVILVDVDFRRPGIGKILGLRPNNGLSDLLSERSTLKEVTQIDKVSGLYIITTGRPVPNPPDILASDRMKHLITKLENSYDMVIFDAPPVLAVSDARVLSNEVNATVFLVRWADTPREMAIQGIKQMVASGGKITGVLLSMVDAAKHAKYGYGDSGYYYGRIKKYYAS